MMKVVFRGLPNQRPGIHGKLNIPPDSDLGQYVGQRLPFSTEPSPADTGLKWEGVVARAGSEQYYEFRKLEWDENTRTGSLRLVSQVGESQDH